MVRIHSVGVVIPDGDAIVMMCLCSCCLGLCLGMVMSSLICVLLLVMIRLLMKPRRFGLWELMLMREYMLRGEHCRVGKRSSLLPKEDAGLGTARSDLEIEAAMLG